MKVWRFLALLPLLAAAAACGGSHGPASVKVDSGGQIRLSLVTYPANIDPATAAVGDEVAVSSLLFRGLLWFDPQLKLVPLAAKELPSVDNGGISRDGLIYTFKLRDGIVWSDGQPLTAGDFEYAVKRALDPGTGAQFAPSLYVLSGAEAFNTCKICTEADLSGLREKVGVRAADDRTLVFTLKNPDSNFLYVWTQPIGSPVRRDLIERYGNQWTEPGHFAGTGPFVISERVAPEKVVLTPNQRWWGTKAQVGSVSFKVIPSPLDAFNAYLAGDIDVAGVPSDQKKTVDNDPALRAQNAVVPQFVSTGYFFNNLIPPFDNQKVRQAFALAVDREAFVAKLLLGLGEPAYSWLPPGSAAYSRELGRQWTLDSAKAKKLLAEAGYPGGKGLPVVTYAYPKGQSQPYAEFLQQQLQQNLGVSIELQPMEPKDWQDALLAKRLMLAYVGWKFPGVAPEASLVDLFGCQRYAGDKCASFPPNNVEQYANPEVDRILQQAVKETDTTRRRNLYRKAQETIVSDSPIIYLAYRSQNVLVRPSVKGLVMTRVDGLLPGLYFLEKAYIVEN